MNDEEVSPIVVIGAGPAGMATALALHAVGHPVRLYERMDRPRAGGAILNLWPPAIKALGEIGVDTEDIGAPCDSTFRNARDHIRAHVNISPEVVQEYRGGFIGMLRPDLFERMQQALPPGILVCNRGVTKVENRSTHVELTLEDGTIERAPLVVGADGINSTVRSQVFGPTPIRDHRLLLIGGYTFDVPASVDTREAVIRHSRSVQGSHTGIRSQGKDGAEWWFVIPWEPGVAAPIDLHAYALELAREFPSDLQELIARTDQANVSTWPIRDRGEVPKTWSKGRVVLAGDSVHATSPYAAYGAGMSIADGYFLGQLLDGVDLADTAAITRALERYSALRADHCGEQVERAHMLGRIFHHLPTIARPFRDLLLDRTRFLQKMVGDKNPEEIIAQLDVMGAGLRLPAA